MLLWTVFFKLVLKEHTAGGMTTVPAVYTLLMHTIHLSHSTQGAEGTVLGNTWYIYQVFPENGSLSYWNR